MRQRIKISVVVLLLNFFTNCINAKSQLLYTIEKSGVSLKVKLNLTGDRSGKTRLYYPNEFWGQENMFQVISDIQSPGNTVDIEKSNDGNFIIIGHLPGKPIIVEYSITQDFTNSIANELYYRPIIQPDWFHIFGHCLFMMPEQLMEIKEKINISLVWKNFRPEFKIHNSFGSQQSTQSINETSERFLNSIFVGGDFRIYKSVVKKRPFYFAIRGNWINITDTGFVKLLQKTITAQRNFWNDYKIDYFTVTLIPTYADDKSLSLAGEGLTNSFSCYFSNNKRLDMGFKTAYLFNHELMHQWIGHTIIPQREEVQYWFKEGFTDYFACKNMLTSDIIDTDTWLTETNDFFIKPLYTSSVKEAPNDSITKKNFWKNPDYQKLPYKRGYVFALYLDMKIKKETKNKHSLTDVMRDLLLQVKNKGQMLTDSLFIKEVDKFISAGIQKDFERNILQGWLINFSQDDVIPCLILRQKEDYPLFELNKNFTDAEIKKLISK